MTRFPRLALFLVCAALGAVPSSVAFAQKRGGSHVGDGGFAFTNSIAVLNAARAKLIAELPALRASGAVADLTLEREELIRSLVINIDLRPDEEAVDPVSGQELMFNFFPRPGEKGEPKIIAQRKFFIAYMGAAPELQDVLVPDLMRRLLHEASHTWGYDEAKSRAFALELVPIQKPAGVAVAKPASVKPAPAANVAPVTPVAPAALSTADRRHIEDAIESLARADDAIAAIMKYMTDEIPVIHAREVAKAEEISRRYHAAKGDKNRLAVSHEAWGAALAPAYRAEVSNRLAGGLGGVADIVGGQAVTFEEPGSDESTRRTFSAWSERLRLMSIDVNFRSMNFTLLKSWDDETAKLASLQREMRKEKRRLEDRLK